MKRCLRPGALVLAALLFASCARWDGTYYYDNAVFADFDPSSLAGERPAPITLEVGEGYASPDETTAAPARADSPDAAEGFALMTVLADGVPIYATANTASRQIDTLRAGDIVEMSLTTTADGFRTVKIDGSIAGYSPDGYTAAGELHLYGELPVEHGEARNEKNEYVPASSHLVDLTRYTDDVIITMQLATSDTSIGEPFYSRNLCMLQYDTVQKLLKAIEIFKADGYTIRIYDAYRPTSVQQRWFDIIRVHKWVADPSIGMGGRHDRGCAIDMALVDANGNLLEFPTPMHTFSDAAARASQMSAEARKNVDYMTQVMVSCGFDYINSEWWHFQDTEIESYLPTDHPIDEIPLVAAER
ncbi:MAG: M15 family metallopeptidase [Clostridia bacterium]|nr:M15 family metallopeptidase [Clostridia bacterium]